MIGETKKYFIPDLSADEMIVHESEVLGEELDPQDVTIKVKFLDGHWVQKFAVADTEEELQKAFDYFQKYRKKYHECLEKIQPIEKECREFYANMYPEYIDVELGQKILARRDAEKSIAEYEARQQAANGE